MRNLIIVGDPFHPPETQAPSHVAIMASIGIECDVEDDVEAGCRKLASGKYNLLTFSAARWRMLNAASDPADSEAIPPPPQPDPCWAMSLSGTGRTAILAHLRGGGALLAMHAATIAFDDWPEWGEIVGARWVWGRSGHPPLGRVQTRFTPGSNSPLIVDLAPFDCEDEAYGGMWIAPDVKRLLRHALQRRVSPDQGARGRLRCGRASGRALGSLMTRLATPRPRSITLCTGGW
jgi:uncharacterized protein